MADLDMVLSDLNYRAQHTDSLPVELEGCKVLLSSIYSISGGKTSSRSYLDRVQQSQVTLATQKHQAAYDDRLGSSREEAPQSHDTRQQSQSLASLEPANTRYIETNSEAGINMAHGSDFGAEMPFDLWQWNQWDSFFNESFASTNLQKTLGTLQVSRRASFSIVIVKFLEFYRENAVEQNGQRLKALEAAED
ncbi:hypothetical protein K469DRAFT_767667 [Zopfia rhizophila CBS 207.26]|uniref:Uncharacterized protein n=1 Tax=Zopfia rhizophila CBS 207.26 TaxID=1314779 RepID=A0A6A6EDF5_9PEZI|nr:hypothetical protein K469DRAFT_767667 [Zopfia rhizophila CBS 207.26]